MNNAVIREIEVGGIPKNEILEILKVQSIQLNEYAYLLFSDPLFTTTFESQKFQFVEVSVEDIGLVSGGTSAQIFSAANEIGLGLCSLEFAPHFRMQYLDQNEGPYLTIASKKTKEDENYPNGFYLRNVNGQLWLRGYRATTDYIWHPSSKFVFFKI